MAACHSAYCDTCYHGVVCSSMCMCGGGICDIRARCESRWMERDAIWQGHLCDPM